MEVRRVFVRLEEFEDISWEATDNSGLQYIYMLKA